MFQKISEKIFAFLPQNQGSNCFLLKGEKENCLIDSSSVENWQEIRQALSGIGTATEQISLILHTHGHADHFGNDSLFPKAKIAMHEKDAERINAGEGEFACIHFFQNGKMPKISIFLKAGQEIDLGGISLKAIHCPGHTAGSLCFLEPEQKILFSGDTLFAGSFGRTDLASGSPLEMAQSIGKLQKIPFKALLPGHGPILFGEKENRENLENALRLLKR